MDSSGVQNDFHSVDLINGGAPKDHAKFLLEFNRRNDGTSDPQIWVVCATAVAANGKLYGAWADPRGLVLWREP